MPSILWGTNVYSRLNHLHLQQALIRRHFGDRAELLTFSNHETNGRSELLGSQDRLYIHPVNSGGHTGCQDAYNTGLRYVRPEHRFVVWTHADCIVADYSLIDEVMSDMDLEGAVFACLEGVTRRNNPRMDFGNEGPYVLNDLMVFTADFYRRVFPRAEVLDGFVDGVMSPYGVEVAMGIWVNGSLREGETVHAIGHGVRHHQLAEDLGTTGTVVHMKNRFEDAADFVRATLDPETVAWLDGLRLLDRRYDDRRMHPGYDG